MGVGRRAAGSRLLELLSRPPTSGFKVPGSRPGRAPPSARGLGGRRPRPRSGRQGTRGPTAATQWRPQQAPRDPAAASPQRGEGSGRFQNRPAQWGRGGERGLSNLWGSGGYLTFSETALHSSHPPPESNEPQFGRPGYPQRGRVSTTLTRGRHFLAFLLVLATSVSLSLSL